MAIEDLMQTLGLRFGLAGDLVAVTHIGRGHIHDTYAVTYRIDRTVRRYIHQRINTHVFRDPVRLMENIRRVTEHLHERLALEGAEEIHRKTLTLIAAESGEFFSMDEQGNHWRTYHYIERASTFDIIRTPDQAYQAARAFGHFQAMLVDLPGPRLHESIPDFHNTPRRFAAFEKALREDCGNRASEAAREIEFALSRRHLSGVLLDLHRKGEIPERITHNDTKFNNVMLDEASGEGICVIDLDTVMPGLALYDFGDMVRTGTNLAEEDELDLSRVRMDLDLYRSLLRGYLESTNGFLTDTERASLAFSGKLITYEQGLRFLTDYLMGDVYYKIHRSGHNLDRCRTQFRLVESIEDQEEAMDACLGELLENAC